MKIGILHYSMPPTVGGVERIIAAHAKLFQEHGHEVVLLCDASRERTRLACSLRRPAGNILPLAAQKDSGTFAEGSNTENVLGGTPKTARETRALPLPSPQPVPGFTNDGNFEESKNDFYNFIVQLKLDVLFVHNVFTMPFCLAATAACHELARSDLRVVSWVHDIAAVNSDYQIPTTAPHSLLRSHPLGAHVVAVSEHRASVYRDLTNFSEVRVIPNGIDTIQEIAGTLLLDRPALAARLRNAYPILFHPTRILRRKNIALGIHIVAALGKQGFHPLLLISGAPEPFSGQQSIHRAELDQLCAGLGVENDVHFLSDAGAVSDSEMGELYQLSDALFFPSEQEGFGLPVLEAGLRRLPIFASNIQPLASLVEAYGLTFAPDIAPAELACQITNFLSRNPASHVRQTVRRDFDWQTIYSRHILPLLESLF